MDELPPEFWAPSATINLHGLEGQIFEDAIHISSRLRGLLTSAESYASCAYIFQNIDISNGFNIYNISAQIKEHCARASTIYLKSFADNLSRLRASSGKHPIFRDRIDLFTLKKIDNDFARLYPDAHNARHVTAHPEWLHDPQKNMSITPNANIRVGMIMGQNGISMSLEGREIFIHLTIEDARQIIHWANIIALCFREVSVQRRILSGMDRYEQRELHWNTKNNQST